MSNEPNAALGLPASVLRSVRRLTQRRGRDVARAFLAEGRQAVREALAADGLVQELIVEDPAKHADLIEGLDVPVWVATQQQMRHLSDTVTPQGVIAVVRQLDFGWDALDGAKLVVICAQVRDPGNAGTVIRAADAAGCDAVIFVDDCVDVLNPKVIRSTAGSLFHLPVLAMSTDEFFTWTGDHNMDVWAADVYGTEERKPESLPAVLADKAAVEAPKAVLFGNEARGLEPDILTRCGRIVSIPLYGKAESLNLGTSAAVMLMSLSMSGHVERM